MKSPLVKKIHDDSSRDIAYTRIDSSETWIRGRQDITCQFTTPGGGNFVCFEENDSTLYIELRNVLFKARGDPSCSAEKMRILKDPFLIELVSWFFFFFHRSIINHFIVKFNRLYFEDVDRQREKLPRNLSLFSRTVKKFTSFGASIKNWAIIYIFTSQENYKNLLRLKQENNNVNSTTTSFLRKKKGGMKRGKFSDTSIDAVARVCYGDR